MPFPRDSQSATLFAHINDPVPVPSQVAAELAVFDSILTIAMAKDPRERFATAGEFALALGVPPPGPAVAVVAAPSPVAPPPPPE